MVWGSFLYNKILELPEVKSHQTTASYIDMLRKASLISESPYLCGENWIFQQENAATHNAHRSEEFFMENNIQFSGHPPCSLDQN